MVAPAPGKRWAGDALEVVVDTPYLIKVTGESVADAEVLASDLHETLLDSHDAASVERRSAGKGHLDGGAILAIVLGSSATLAIAKGIQAFLSRNPRASLRFTRPDGTVVEVDNVAGRHVARLAETLFGGRP